MINSVAPHYVYEWVRPDYNEAYYVGKGSGKRAYYMFRDNDYTNYVTAKLIRNGIPTDIRIIAWFENEDAAYAYEEERIAFLKPLGFLTNKTDGGNGRSGFSHTEQFKELMSEYAKDPSHPIHSRESVEKRTESLLRFYNSEKGKIVVLERTHKATKSKIEYFATDKGKEQARLHGDNLIELFKTERGREIAKQIGQSRKAFNETEAGRICAVETGKKISLTNRGEGNGRAKINAQQAMEIYLDPRPIKEIAEFFGVNKHCVHDIKYKRSWKHIHKETK
jgi:hypothetical protein